jgi:putative thiamine transport system permease protein
MKRILLNAPLGLFFIFPLMLSFIFSLSAIFEPSAWTALFLHPQIWSALLLSIFTGLTSTFIALFCAVFIVARSNTAKLLPLTGAMIALPHVAFAIGVSFLIMPSGIVARVLAVIFGWTSPPNWITTHDPFGLSLIAVLALKEVPFLVWILASLMNREDIRRTFSGQRAAALSLGHDINSIWLRIFLPQVLPKIIWPIFIVYIYAATVVDMALVIGPTQPPPFALVVWADLNDAQVINNARGAVGAVFLSTIVAGVAVLVWALLKVVARNRDWLSVGAPFNFSSGMNSPTGRMKSLATFYVIIVGLLFLLSLSPAWSFPHLWPDHISFAAWSRVWMQPSALVTSLLLAIATTLTALVLIIAWFETRSQNDDRWLFIVCAVALGLPSILLGLGQYKLALVMGLSGTAVGLFLAHLIPVLAYMFVVLAGPYRAFDPRWHASACGLMVKPSQFLMAIKFPLLKAPLLASSAIGFAVSFVQYVPAQLISAGRFSTLPMEAVTLTSGSNRPLTAAFALLLMMPPLLIFLFATYFGKSRWGRA